MKSKLAPCSVSQESCARARICTWLFLGAVFTALSGLSGCGESRVGRHELSGQITYDGKPVPNGYLRFAPDRSKGNSGPGSYADIKGGKYEMMPGQGTIGGPHVVSIFGTDGIEFTDQYGSVIPIGRPLFEEYEVSIDVPEEAATLDFEVPKETKGKKKR